MKELFQAQQRVVSQSELTFLVSPWRCRDSLRGTVLPDIQCVFMCLLLSHDVV